MLAGWLRQEYGTSVGIVMATARGMCNDRVECRRAGVDDYLVKPIEFGELLALIDNLLARLTPAKPLSQPWQLIVAHSELRTAYPSTIQLTFWEVALLAAIADAPEQIAHRNDLIRALGKDPDHYDPRALEATISRLRRKLPMLDENRNPLESVRNVGYRFVRQLIVVR